MFFVSSDEKSFFQMFITLTPGRRGEYWGWWTQLAKPASEGEDCCSGAYVINIRKTVLRQFFLYFYKAEIIVIRVTLKSLELSKFLLFVIRIAVILLFRFQIKTHS